MTVLTLEQERDLILAENTVGIAGIEKEEADLVAGIREATDFELSQIMLKINALESLRSKHRASLGEI